MALKEFEKGGSKTGKEKLNSIVKKVNKLDRGGPITLSLCTDGIIVQFIIRGYRKQEGVNPEDEESPGNE
jgi:hypothetical protein